MSRPPVFDALERQQFADFMRSYQDMVFSTAARVTGHTRYAEDIAQEVFLSAYENFDHLRTSPTAGGWLKKVAMNMALNHVHRYRRRWRFFSELREHDDAPEVDFPTPDAAPAAIAAEQRHALIERLLMSLPDHQRVPLVLFHFEELPYDEIARRLQVSLAKVKVDIHRGRAALAKALGGNGAADQVLP